MYLIETRTQNIAFCLKYREWINTCPSNPIRHHDKPKLPRPTLGRAPDFSRNDYSTSVSDSIKTDLLNKIYSPLYSKIAGSLEILDRGTFGCGERGNNLGERVINVVSGLKKNILWEKADQELKNKVESLHNLFEELNLLEDKLANEIMNSFYNKFDFMKEMYSDEIKRIVERIKELRYFILKDYDQLDSTRIQTITEFLDFTYRNNKIEHKNSQSFWREFQNFALTSLHYVDYKRKREDWKNCLNEIKNLLSSFI